VKYELSYAQYKFDFRQKGGEFEVMAELAGGPMCCFPAGRRPHVLFPSWQEAPRAVSLIRKNITSFIIILYDIHILALTVTAPDSTNRCTVLDFERF